MSKPTEVVVFDLDGCICDDRHRLHLKPGHGAEDEDWRHYHDEGEYDAIMNADIVNAYIADQVPILIVTARPERYREATEAWLKEYLPDLTHLSIWRVPMRPKNNVMGSAELKIHLVETMTGHPIWIRKAYADRVDVLRAYAEYGVATQFLSYAPVQTVPEILNTIAETYHDRQKRYGKSYLRFGAVASGLWPQGLRLDSHQDFVRHGILIQIISKLVRYADKPAGHKDSAHDMALYAAMLEEQTDE